MSKPDTIIIEGRAYAAYGGIYISASLVGCGLQKASDPTAGILPASSSVLPEPR